MAEIPIDEMEPGRGLDQLVARRLMGWMPRRACAGEIAVVPGGWRCRRCGKMGDEGERTEHPEHPPRVSTNLGTAWRLLDRFVRDGARVEVSGNTPERGPEPWCAVIDLEGVEHRSGAETAPVAICRAALKASGVQTAEA